MLTRFLVLLLAAFAFGVVTPDRVKGAFEKSQEQTEIDAATQVMADSLSVYINEGGGSGSGAVTSVALSLPSSVFAVSGSPITTAGTLTGSFQSQAANTVFAGPSGASGAPVFRAFLPGDISFLTDSMTWLRTYALARIHDTSLTLRSLISAKENALGNPSTNGDVLVSTTTGVRSWATLPSSHNPVTIGTANGLSLATQQLSLGLATSTTAGALSASNWSTFNSKIDATAARVIVHDTSLAIRAAFPDSVRASHIADTAKRAGWAPLDSVRVRAIVNDSATTQRSYALARVSDTATVLRSLLSDTSSVLRASIAGKVDKSVSRLQLGTYVNSATDTMSLSSRHASGIGTHFGRWHNIPEAPKIGYFNFLMMPETPSMNTHNTIALPNTGKLAAYIGRGTTTGSESWIRLWSTEDFDSTMVALWGTWPSRLSDTSAALRALIAVREPALGNPSSNGQVVSSTTGGVRSWASMQPLDADLTSIAELSTQTYGRSLLTQADAPTARATLGIAGSETINRSLKSATAIGWYKLATIKATAQTHVSQFLAEIVSIGRNTGTTENGRRRLYVRLKQNSAMSSPIDIIQCEYTAEGGSSFEFGYVVEQDDATEKRVSIYANVTNSTEYLRYTVVESYANFSANAPVFFEDPTPLGSAPSSWVTASLGSVKSGSTTVGSLLSSDQSGTGSRLVQVSSTGAQSASIAVPTAFAQTLLDDADAATARSTLGAGTGNGTVTSVALTPPANMSVSGSPVTTSGTLGLVWNGSASNLVRADGSTMAVPPSLPPSGSAGGDLTGTYPNPTLGAVGTAGTYKSVTTDAKGRVTSGTNPTTLAGYGITDAMSSNSGFYTDNTVGGVTTYLHIGNDDAGSGIYFQGAGSAAYYSFEKLYGANPDFRFSHGSEELMYVFGAYPSMAIRFGRSIYIPSGKSYEVGGTPVVGARQTGMGTTLPAATIGGTYNSTTQAQIQALYDKVILLETKLKAHGLIAN